MRMNTAYLQRLEGLDMSMTEGKFATGSATLATTPCTLHLLNEPTYVLVTLRVTEVRLIGLHSPRAKQIAPALRPRLPFQLLAMACCTRSHTAGEKAPLFLQAMLKFKPRTSGVVASVVASVPSTHGCTVLRQVSHATLGKSVHVPSWISVSMPAEGVHLKNRLGMSRLQY